MRLVVVFGIFVSSDRSFSAHEIAGYCFGGGRAGIAAGAGISPYGGFRGGRRHEGLGVLLSVSPYAGVRPRGETL